MRNNLDPQMNSYTFVPKLQHLSSHQPSSSLMQRLQQLKASMSPASQLQYSSIPPSSNAPNQYGSVGHNQRLFEYLPKEKQYGFARNQNQQGIEEYESYRKSLEKKLNYLFEKEKHIMKTQSTNEQLRGRQQAKHQQGYVLKGEPNKRQYTQELERKYSQLKQQQKGLNLQPLQQQAQPVSPQRSDYRQYKKIHSTMQSNNFQRNYSYGRRDEQIDQMQRKIRMLEMKYLGTYSQMGTSPKQYEKDYTKAQKIVLSQVSEILPKKIGEIGPKIVGKMSKIKNKTEKTSPDFRPKNKLLSSQNQTIEPTSNGNKQEKPSKQTKPAKKQSPQKKKHPIKDYMNTIQHQTQQQNQHQTQQQKQHTLPQQPDSQLHRQFNELKRQFHTLLQISKTMIEKVEMSEEQKIIKRDKKLKAKAMLKEIILRLDEIKWEIQGQPRTGYKTLKNTFAIERVKAKSQCEPRFQKSSNKTLENKTIDSKALENKTFHWEDPMEKKTIERGGEILTKGGFSGHKKSRAQYQAQTQMNKNPKQINNNQNIPNDTDQIQKLKKLLTLQVEHRQLVQRKLQFVYGNQILAQNL